jgi:hypothetical protein
MAGGVQKRRGCPPGPDKQQQGKGEGGILRQGLGADPATAANDALNAKVGQGSWCVVKKGG